MVDRPLVSIVWLDHFAGVADPRQKAKVLYPLPEILLCGLCGILCGAESCAEIEEYGELKLDFLRRFLPFDHGIPSHDTFCDVFNTLDATQFQAAFIAWTSALQEQVREIVAIDGKTLRRSFDRKRGQGPIHMVSAWACGQRLVLGQTKVAAKENEIVAIPDLLDLLTVKGAIVTIDAMGCQTAIAAKIVERGADYLLALKANQPDLHRDIKQFMAEQRACAGANCAPGSWHSHETIDADHGRIETRRHWIASDIAWLRVRHPRWMNLTSIAMIETTREVEGRTSVQTRLYISSLAADAAVFAHAARQHWGIENRLHWVMDVIFREDECRTRRNNGPANLSTLRRVAQNLVRKETSKGSIRIKRKRAGWDNDFMQAVLAAA